MIVGWSLSLMGPQIPQLQGEAFGPDDSDDPIQLKDPTVFFTLAGLIIIHIQREEVW